MDTRIIIISEDEIYNSIKLWDKLVKDRKQKLRLFIKNSILKGQRLRKVTLLF